MDPFIQQMRDEQVINHVADVTGLDCRRTILLLILSIPARRALNRKMVFS